MPCSHDDCQQEPAWRPAFDLRSSRSDVPTRLHFNHLGYCSDHKEALQIDTFLSDEGHTKISKFMRESGKRAPDAALTTLVWEPLSPADVTKLAANQDRTLSSEVDPF